MPGEEETIRVAREWWGRSNPTPVQKERKRKTGSLYERDKVVSQYEVRKGEYV